MKKINKSTGIKIACGVALAIVCIGVLFFLFHDAYKPDEDALSVVNEASSMLYRSEILDEYKRKGTKRIDGKKFFIFEFTLNDGNKASFAFAKDLKETRKLYSVKNGEFSLVLFPDVGGENLDNDAQWPDSWS